MGGEVGVGCGGGVWFGGAVCGVMDGSHVGVGEVGKCERPDGRSVVHKQGTTAVMLNCMSGICP